MNESSPCQIDEPFRVRAIARGAMGLFSEWAAKEGWNPGRHDAPCFHDADPQGMLVAELQGQPVACIACTRYGEGFGFVGQYIVKPEFRGRGFGLRLWTAGLARLAGRNVGLDGVLEQVANYEKSGFRLSHHHTRFGGSPAGKSSPGLVKLDAVPFAEVLTYDRQCFPAPREAFLRSWLAQPESAALGLVREGMLAGFGVARRAVEGFKVGPLFADDAEAADVLFLGLAQEVGGPLVIDVAEASAQPESDGFVRRHGLTSDGFVRRHGLTEVFRCARMYTRGRPAIADHKVFGVTSLELG